MSNAPAIFERIRRLGYTAGRIHRYLGGRAPGLAAFQSTYNGARYQSGYAEGHAADPIETRAEYVDVQRERNELAAQLTPAPRRGRRKKVGAAA